MTSSRSIDLAGHPWFEPWRDPQSAVTSYVLTERVAPMQRAMYHTVRSTSGDGRWLWFTAIFPPSKHFCLAAACLDPRDLSIRYFPHCPITPLGGNPLVFPEGDRAYVVVEDAVYLQPVDGRPQIVVRPELPARGHLFRLCTHLSLSCDGRQFVFDSHIGNAFYLTLIDRGGGHTRLLKRFFHNHHHALFSPVDPDLILVGQGPWTDPITGQRGDEDLRAWIMSTDGARYEAIMPDIYSRGPRAALHEFWTPDGMVGWCSRRDGVFETDVHLPPSERRRVRVWGRGMTHAHCNGDRTLYCGDTNPYEWSPDVPCGVWFFNRTTGAEVAIATGLPYPESIPFREKRAYHFDPHPSFTADGRHVVYTTTVFGRLDVAMTPVEHLLEITGTVSPR